MVDKFYVFSTFLSIIKSLLFVVVSFVYLVVGLGVPQEPSDKQLENKFFLNEDKFNVLISMTNEDKKLVRIAPSFIRLDTNWNWPRPPSQLGFSPERWDKYWKFFQMLEIKDGIQREKIDDKQHECIFLFMYSWGLAIGQGGISKGYAYCNASISPLVDSLDVLKDNKTYFKKLKGNWYLYRGR